MRSPSGPHLHPSSEAASRSLGRRLTAEFAAPALALIFMAAFPLLGAGPNVIRLLFITLVWVTASIAWNVVGGFAGQVSFGFAVFYGLGAYATAMSLNAGLLRPLALLVGAMVAALASIIIGLPTFRLRGPYFAIATIGVSEAVRVVMTNVAFTGGASGYRVTEKGAFSQHLHYYTALALAVIGVLVVIAIRRSRLGLALLAIREDEDAASDLGVDPFRSKILAHAIGAALAGAAGGVYTGYAAFIYPQGVFGFDISVAILLMPIIGGVGTVWGPVIGGLVYGFVHEELIASFPQLHLLLYGSLLILIILFEPGGVLGLFHQLTRLARARSGSGPAS
jgi:branched-chain amino acid transport system permease protein